MSSPGGTFGGWLSLDSLVEEENLFLAKWLIRNSPRLTWRHNPYAPAFRFADVGAWREDYTFALDLSTGFDRLLHRWSKGHRSAANSAHRSGVTIRYVEDVKGWRDYFALYLSSLDRWGERTTSRYEWTFFEVLAQLKSPYVHLWLAYVGGVPVAGALCLQAKEHLVYWHGAADGDWFAYHPVHLLIREIVRDAIARRLRWFDFNPSGGHQGVTKFKQGFGPDAKAAPVMIKCQPDGTRSRSSGRRGDFFGWFLGRTADGGND